MVQSIQENPGFYRAVSLRERARLLKKSSSDASFAADIDSTLADDLLREWQEQSPFKAGDYFRERLALDEIAEGDFRRLLGEPPESIQARLTQPPDWLKEIDRAFSASPAGTQSFEIPSNLRELPEAGFLNLIRPLIDRGFDRLRSTVRRLLEDANRPDIDPDSASALFFSGLPAALLGMLLQTMVLELNVARLQGWLPGESSEARFESFIIHLSRPETRLTLLAEYPVLARRLVNHIDRWVDFGIEFIGHLAADWNALAVEFNKGHSLGHLVEITGGAGDSHRGGRTVLLLKFSSDLKLVYKPRPMAVDGHFQQLIQWANGQGIEPNLRVLAVYDRGDHGWSEFVEAKPCTSEDELKRFYERQGIYLALLYALEAVDFHYENLIASGEHPVLIDLESLFHPDVRTMGIEQPDAKLVANFVTDSVLRIGLLPSRSWAHNEFEGIDLSGLGARRGQPSPDRFLDFVAVGTDEMRAVRSRRELGSGSNRPSLAGLEANALDYVDDIVAGFTRAYQALHRNRDELLAAGGPLRCFSEDQVRVVVRATRGYGVLLQESLHPDFLKDGLDLDLFLDRVWVGVEDNEHLLSVIPSERADLARDDIPLFTTTPVSHDLRSSEGPIPNYIRETGIERVERRVSGFCSEDLQRQIWLIRSSLATLALADNELKWPRYEEPALSQIVWPADGDERVNDAHWGRLRPALIAQACAVADRIISGSISDGRDLAWIGLSFSNKRWSLDPLLEDLYGGSSGLILSLAYLGAATGEDRYTRIARAALGTLRARLEYSSERLTAIGAFSGWGGILYLLSHLLVLWNDRSMLSQASSILDRLRSLIGSDEDIDIIGGSAGCIGSLLSLFEVTGLGEALDLALACGDRILSRARVMEQGAGWFTRIDTVKPITGFSHGASGIAWALIKLASATGEQRFLPAALDAITYEGTCFSAAEGNWLDTGTADPELQPLTAGPALSVSWCYGAPGIGLARIAASRCFSEPFVGEELKAAADTTLKRGFGRNHSLCHGDLGNLDF
ncbi:MAG TPA: type 2 lanthipeptide synthetase LanM family protein, partial [Blastocatellia bacterium]|nr:type 2 lanthipeptide synthetase LanM family protein [Blastocatellia bacterium]